MYRSLIDFSSYDAFFLNSLKYCSGLLECPCTTRINKLVNITYATQNQGKCDTAVTRPSECYNAAVKLDPSMANAKFLVLDSKQFPEGCSMIHYNNGTADVVLNKRTESVEACGAGAQQWLGKCKIMKKNTLKSCS